MEGELNDWSSRARAQNIRTNHSRYLYKRGIREQICSSHRHSPRLHTQIIFSHPPRRYTPILRFLFPISVSHIPSSRLFVFFYCRSTAHPMSLQMKAPYRSNLDSFSSTNLRVYQEVTSSAEQSWYPMNTVASSSFNSESSQDLSIIPYTMASGDELLTYQSVAALRAHLLQNINSPPPAQTHTLQIQGQGQGQASTPPTETKPGSTSPHDMNIDPAISGVGVTSQTTPQAQQHMMVQPQSPPLNNNAGMSPGGTGGMDQHSGAEETGAEGSGQKRGGKRELSTSKRAAQNRAAQVIIRLLANNTLLTRLIY